MSMKLSKKKLSKTKVSKKNDKTRYFTPKYRAEQLPQDFHVSGDILYCKFCQHNTVRVCKKNPKNKENTMLRTLSKGISRRNWGIPIKWMNMRRKNWLHRATCEFDMPAEKNGQDFSGCWLSAFTGETQTYSSSTENTVNKAGLTVNAILYNGHHCAHNPSRVLAGKEVAAARWPRRRCRCDKKETLTGGLRLENGLFERAPSEADTHISFHSHTPIIRHNSNPSVLWIDLIHSAAKLI